jgi:site-specific DNA-methyltransferase (adenine-specific)
MEGIVHHTDLLSLCAQLEPASVDMILCDLPYGTTACSWDTVIPFAPMWAAFRRIVKPRAAIVLTASQPFTSALVMSNPKWFRYEWVWDKVNRYTNYGNVSFAPLKRHESVLTFCESTPTYYPQMARGIPYIARRSGNMAGVYKDGGLHPKDGINLGERFPHSIIAIEADNKLEVGLHPTQKPVDLFRYLIRTYTRPGDLVVDPCVGSGTTALAARAEGRRYIVGDSSAEYCEVARKRLDAPYTLPMLGLFAEEGA